MTWITSHLRTNVVGYLALFVALSAGAYAAGLAPNSVKSKHIKDGQVQLSDIAGNSIEHSNVIDGRLLGHDFAPNSVTGQQVAENTLGEVPNATIAGHGGYGRQSGGPEAGTGCHPGTSDWVTCGTVALTPSAPARVLVTGRFTAVLGGDLGGGEALCRLGTSTTGGIPGTTVAVRVELNEDEREWVTIVGITHVFQPGNYSFGLDCKNASGEDEEAIIEGARVTAVAISPY